MIDPPPPFGLCTKERRFFMVSSRKPFKHLNKCAYLLTLKRVGRRGWVIFQCKHVEAFFCLLTFGHFSRRGGQHFELLFHLWFGHFPLKREGGGPLYLYYVVLLLFLHDSNSQQKPEISWRQRSSEVIPSRLM